jgi:hypothetical protein
MEARNLSVHTYDQTLARKLCTDIRDRYLGVFGETLGLIQNYVANRNK